MEDSEKRTIVLASVLKPVNDTRMTEKIGRSLVALPATEVHIIGFPAGPKDPSPLIVHPLPAFSRLGFRRLLIPFQILKKVVSLRPHLLIITTHELLAMALMARLLTRCRIVYDVQENYFRNIRYTATFPVLVRPLLARYVRWKERIAARLIDHFFLAEKAYRNEFSFHRGRYTVLENKARSPGIRPIARKRKSLLFTGTIAESTGIFKAIEIAILLHHLDAEFTLTIIGYCSQPPTLKKIRQIMVHQPFITLIGGDQLVPHNEILAQISSAGAGIIAYPYNPSTYSSIPTKLYEYLAYQLPIILPFHPGWISLCEGYQAGVVFNWKNPDGKAILDQLMHQPFYRTTPRDVCWESEEEKLIPVVSELITRPR